MNELPYVGAQALRRDALVTFALRAGLGVVLVALVLAAAAAARTPRLSEQPFLPAQAGGVVVLDLSASITSDTYSRIQQTLRELVARGGRYGLVVFSNDAYEALPPGTPASALEPLIRFFTVPPQTAPGALPNFPISPWTDQFTSGTEIANALQLADQIELQDGVRHPAILLVSDLGDDPNDVQRLIGVLSTFRTTGVELRVIALNPAPNDEALFARMIGNAASIIPAGLSASASHAAPPPPAGARFPTLFVLLALLVAALLAANELRAARLRFGHPAETAA